MRLPDERWARPVRAPKKDRVRPGRALPACEFDEDPSIYLLHVERHPALFWLVRAIASLVSIPLHTAVLATGVWAAIAIIEHWEAEHFSTIMWVALVIALLCHLGQWMLFCTRGFVSFSHLVYFMFRLSVKHAISLVAAFFIATELARRGHTDLVVFGIWLVVAACLPKLESWAFRLASRYRPLSWLCRPAHPPKPAPNPLWRDPEQLRSPPE